MFEGKHIHFSPTDNKPLCSYSGKLCRQRRLNGYAFCIRHILEDKSSPFKQCGYVTRNNSQKCLNAIPSNQDRGYCHSHMQVIGIIPKTERKSKAHPVQNKVDSNSISASADKSSSANNNSKKDPGSVFKFEEDPSDITEVYSYKNGLSSATLNGRGKCTKLRDNGYNSAKDVKNVKCQNSISSTAKFTTKKITDKNKNVYTAVIPASNCSSNNVKTNGKVYHSKSKSTCWSNPTTETLSVSTGGFRSPNKIVTRSTENELNNLHNSEDVRLFEQLKTLKLLDKALPSSGESSTISNSGVGGDAKLQVFPRLAVPTTNVNSITNINSSSSLPVTNHPASDDLASRSSSEANKSEIVSSPPPLITRSNNSIIIKTESKQAVASGQTASSLGNVKANGKGEAADKQHINSDRGVLFTTGSNFSTSCNSNDHCNSIDKDLRNRHEFLAHVRHSFKSQYKSIKKACKLSERCERNGNLRDSLMRCVRIDSGICAQVLLGSGLKLPTICSPSKTELDTKSQSGKKQEFDDYDFVDNDASIPSIKPDNTTPDNKLKNKGKSSNKSIPKRAGKKVNDVEPMFIAKPVDGLDKKEIIQGQITKESSSKTSPTVAVSAAKRKLRRTDALALSPENSLESGGVPLNENSVSCNKSTTERVDISIAKKQRLDLSEMTALETELALSLNDQSSASHEERIASTAHQTLNQNVGHIMNHAPHELHEILSHPQLSSSVNSHRNQGLETVLNSVGSSENAGTPDGVITDASFDSTFEHSTSSQPDCEFSEDDLEHSFELQIDPEIESQASRLLEDNVLTEADFTELFPDNRMSDHKFGRNDLQELGMTGLEFDVNDIDYSLFANIFPNFPRSGQPESISISNQF